MKWYLIWVLINDNSSSLSTIDLDDKRHIEWLNLFSKIIFYLTIHGDISNSNYIFFREVTCTMTVMKEVNYSDLVCLSLGCLSLIWLSYWLTDEYTGWLTDWIIICLIVRLSIMNLFIYWAVSVWWIIERESQSSSLLRLSLRLDSWI